jgi:hypothetical protein
MRESVAFWWYQQSLGVTWCCQAPAVHLGTGEERRLLVVPVVIGVTWYCKHQQYIWDMRESVAFGWCQQSLV